MSLSSAILERPKSLIIIFESSSGLREKGRGWEEVGEGKERLFEERRGLATRAYLLIQRMLAALTGIVLDDFLALFPGSIAQRFFCTLEKIRAGSKVQKTLVSPGTRLMISIKNPQ